MKKTIINKTPHPVYILDKDNRVLRTFPKSRGMAKVTEVFEDVDTIDEIPISMTKVVSIEGLPAAKEDVYYIVSTVVKLALPHRTDLSTARSPVRDNSGTIIGVRRLDMGNKLPVNIK